jgi:hypothetical protein
MSGQTPGGLPYAEADDEVVTWPTTSRALAEAVEARLDTGLIGGTASLTLDAQGYATVPIPATHRLVSIQYAQDSFTAGIGAVIHGNGTQIRAYTGAAWMGVSTAVWAWTAAKR